MAEPPGGSQASADRQSNKSFEELKRLIHQKLVDKLDLSRVSDLEGDTLRREIRLVVERLCDTENPLLNRIERERLIDEVLDETFGFGPLEVLLKDPTISDILVNGPHKIYVERRGKLEKTDVKFRDNDHLLQIIDRIVSKVGRRVDETSPMVDARLPDGSRVNAIIPPLALDGPSMSIRRFGANPLKLEDLLNYKAFTPGDGHADGSVPEGTPQRAHQRRHRLRQDDAVEHAVELHRPRRARDHHRGRRRVAAAAGSRGAAGNAARRTSRARGGDYPRPGAECPAHAAGRIIIGECRGAESLDMLQAMNTGHDGSMTTLHANTPRDAQARLETMIMMAGMELPIKAMRQQIASAVDVIIQANRLQGGPRKVTSITEVMGMEQDIIIMQDVFRYKQLGIDQNGRAFGQFEATGVRPTFVSRIEAAGIKLPSNLFAERVLLRD